MQKTNITRGLSHEQVRERVAQGLVNRAVEPPSKSVAEIIKSNFYTYFNLVFAVIAGLLIAVGSFRNLTFLPIIIEDKIDIFLQVSCPSTSAEGFLSA